MPVSKLEEFYVPNISFHTPQVTWAKRRPPNTPSINTVPSKRVRNCSISNELTHNLCVCFTPHTDLQGARGEEELPWLHLTELWLGVCRSWCQSLCAVSAALAVHVCPAWSSPAQEQQEPVLYYGLLMSCSTGCWAQTCLCHSLGRSWAANTSTCTGTGRETPGISPGTGQGEQRAGNSQPIVCTKISAAETSSFRNRHPHTLFPFYLGLAHGFRIRICW